MNDPAKSTSISTNNITKVFVDRRNNLWVGTANGLNKYISEDSGFVRFQNDPAKNNSLGDNVILAIYEDKDNELWFATYAGLNKLNADGKTFTRYQKDLSDSTSFGNNYVFSFCEDNTGNFWIGTGGGLEKFDKTSGTFTHIGEKDGLPNPIICGILNDGKGALWISTKKGLTRFSPVNNSYKKTWQQTWVDNSGAYLDFTGGIEGDRVIMSRKAVKKDGSAALSRMIFYDITKNDFQWNWESSVDDGKTWTLLWKIHYVRKN